MLAMLRNLFSLRDHDDHEKRSLAYMLRTLTLIMFITSVATLVIVIGSSYSYLYIPVILLLAFQIISFIFLKQGTLLPAQLLLPSTVFVLVTYVLATGYGLHDINLIGYAIAINLASLTLGIGATFVFTAMAIVAVFAIGYAEMNNIIVSPTSNLTLSISPISISIVMLASAFVQRILMNRLNENLRRARENENQQVLANKELRELQATLESRVDQRTVELEERGMELENISRSMQKRANQLQVVALVGKEITSIQGIDHLLPRVTQVIGHQFDFYHVGIFIIDPNKKIAVLKAANSAGGQKMLAKKHQLKIGESGIVGFVAAFGRPRIALNTGADVTFFNNPDLPDTRSEISLPIKIGNEIIGVLDVQSEKEAAFSEEDTELLAIVADQISIAIQNARLFDEAQKSTADAQALSRQYVRQEWQSITEAETIGYRYSESGFQPILSSINNAANLIEHAQEQSQNSLVIPIKLHNQTIGILRLQPNSERKWSQDVVDISQAVADRVALAVENARLLESSQSQATREHTIGEITAKIGASVNMRNVLQTAVEELGRVLPGSDVVIQIESRK